MSSHTLAIETGRHAKPKIAKEERKCRYCNLDDVEDEKHFLLKCPLYNEERHEVPKERRHTCNIKSEAPFPILVTSCPLLAEKRINIYKDGVFAVDLR